MKSAVAAILILLATISSTQAGLSRAELDAVSVSLPKGARIDPALSVPDADGKMRGISELLSGRTAFVTFVDYTCTTFCGTDLLLLSHALQQSRLAAGSYRIIVVGLDPKDTGRSAREMAHKEIPARLWPNTVLLLPDEASLKTMTRSLGFTYAYDPTIDQFAHPAMVYVVTDGGTVRATLSPFALTTTDIAAVLRNSRPATGLWQHVRLLCYAYDPATGIYTLRILWLLRAGAVLTLLALGSALILLTRRRRLT